MVEDISDDDCVTPSFDLGFNVDSDSEGTVPGNEDSVPRVAVVKPAQKEKQKSRVSCQIVSPKKRPHEDFDDDASAVPLKRIPEIFNQKKKCERSFKSPLSDADLKSLENKHFAPDTHKNICWAVNMYEQWRATRNRNPDNITITASLFRPDSLTKDNLSYGLCRFLTEVKKMDSSDFPSKTLYEILISIQMHLESEGLYWKLIDDSNFVNVKYTLDNLMKLRTEQGMSLHTRKAEVLTYDHEEQLWQCRVLGSSNPEQLINTVVFMVGLHCCLRAGKEHRNLRGFGFDSQFQFVFLNGVRYLKYIEDIGLKTNKGGLKHRKLKPKEVLIFPDTEKRERCPVELVRKYMCKMPQVKWCNAFYLRPLKNYTSSEWYHDLPMGLNALSKVVKRLCARAGTEGHFTNHSLRASSVTRMYQGGIQEKVISEVSGHRSLAVREYQHTNLEQK